jgi:hypothetical protein
MTATSGETFSVNIFYENTEDKNTFTAEQVYEHLENLLLYIKDTTPELSLIQIDEENDGDGWHLNGGWAEITWANNEILRWWEFAYYNELPITQNEGETTS